MSAEWPFIKKSAVTLVELMVVVMIVGLVFVIAVTLTTSMLHFFYKEHSRYKAADELNLALEWIEKDAMQADEVDTSTAGEVTFKITDYSDIDRPYYTVRYNVSGGTQLQRTYTPEGGGATTETITAILDSVNPPAFSSLNNNYFSVDNMYTMDVTGQTAQQRMGVMLRCRNSQTP